MIVALALSLLLVLCVVRRAIEPACPECAAKEWSAHSTQLHCAGCGWSNGARARVDCEPALPAESPQYELCLAGWGEGNPAR